MYHLVIYVVVLLMNGLPSYVDTIELSTALDMNACHRIGMALVEQGKAVDYRCVSLVK